MFSAVSSLLQGTASTPHANHLFNALSSAARQWGSSVHHNGLSFFIAQVPSNTVLYHGSSTDSTPMQGTEWLALEAEHALTFARTDVAQQQQGRENFPQTSGTITSPEQAVLGSAVPASTSDPQNGGWLQSYAAKRDLRLLYIDGMSAAKWPNGTLDSQDLILLNQTCTTTQDCPTLTDTQRVHQLCTIASHTWEGRIDGFLRMETGFEVIVCNATDTVKMVESHRIVMPPDSDSSNPDPHAHHPWGSNFAAWIEAAASRYDGIDGNRAIVSTHEMASAFSFASSRIMGSMLPRAADLTPAQRRRTYEAVTTMVLQDHGSGSSHNVQTLADLVLERYARPLALLASDKMDGIEACRRRLQQLFLPFAEPAAQGSVAREIQRCRDHNLPPATSAEPKTVNAIREVQGVICSETQALLEADDKWEIQQRIRRLMNWLDWPIWKRCGACELGEICFVAMWPFGDLGDVAEPRCKTPAQAQLASSYWLPDRQS